LIDEKIFWRRNPGCHSETVSTAQNRFAVRYLESDKNETLLSRKPAKETHPPPKEGKYI